MTISQSSQTAQMWGGRFSEATDRFVAEFTASVNFDKRMANQDIQGSIAHATMLGACGLNQIKGGIERGEF